MIKIGDLAKATGYSVTTVSKALNNYTDISEKAKQLIIEKANELGYVANAQARALVMKRSFTIGVILDEILNLGMEHPFFSSIIQSFRMEVEANGLDMIFISSQAGTRGLGSYLDHCKQRNVDGVFILCTDSEDEKINQLIQSEIPTVLFDVLTDSTHCVISDHYQGAFDAVTYLINLGHTKIAHISGTELTYAGSERKRAYRDALKQHAIPIREDYIVNGGYFDFNYGKKAMEELLELSVLPTAVFVGGDMMALGAIQACYEHHIRIPEQMSIIGFDNIRLLDWITPALTTVAQDTVQIGKICCSMLIESIKNREHKYQKVILPTHILERGSCASLDKQ